MSFLKILQLDYHHLRSSINHSCVDRHGNPIPWFTYPAIEYLKQLDFSDKTVFEYGTGGSTLFCAARSKKVFAVECDERWYKQISSVAPENTEVALATEKREYINSIHRIGEDFDVIVVDGHYRFECSREAITRLKDGGMIILDNSDWYVETARVLREAGLIQVDLSGFGPINSFTWTTSVFLDRAYDFKAIGGVQPRDVIGGKRENRDRRDDFAVPNRED